MNDQPQTYDLRAMLLALRRRAPFVAAVTLLGAGLAALAVQLSSDSYEAKTTMLVRDIGVTDRIIEGPAILSGTSSISPEASVGLLERDEVLERAAAELGTTREDLESDVVIEAGEGPELIDVIASDEVAAAAAAKANAVAESFVELRREADRRRIADARRGLVAEIRALGASDADADARPLLERQLRRLRTLEAIETGDVEIAEEADVPEDPDTPSTFRSAFLGGFAGLVLGLVAALLLDRARPRLDSRSAFEQALGAPFLGSAAAPKRRRRSRAAAGLDDARRVLAALAPSRRAGPRAVLLASITSADAPQLAVQLARAAELEGLDVSVVDADLGARPLAAGLGVDPGPGIAEVATGDVRPEEAIREAGETGDVHVVTAGAADPPRGALSASPVRELLAAAAARSRLTIVVAPPFGASADALSLLDAVDGVVVVDRIGRVGEQDAADLAALLKRSDAPLQGFVLAR